MKELNEIRDDEIRIIGNDNNRPPRKRWKWVVIIVGIVAAAIAYSAIIFHKNRQLKEPEPAYFEPVQAVEATPVKQQKPVRLGSYNDSITHGYTEIIDTVINDIPLRLFIPHNATMSLHIGRVDNQDTSVIYVAQAADVRADNGGIVGAFVMKGEPLAWGLSKKGFCASIDGKVTVGVAENSPLFEEATEKAGYFFRQYPLVSNGVTVENEVKGKSVRRGICDRHGEIFMTESLSEESFHDFSQALVDLGVSHAIYLVGSSSYGWATDSTGQQHDFGNKRGYRRRMPKNTSFIVWKKK